MVRRTFKGVIHLLGGLGAGFAIIVSLLAWQLSKGPISLGFLTQYLEQAVNAGHPNFSLQLGDTILTWAGWERAVDIRVLDVRVLAADGTGLGSVPEVAFSLSGDALLRGKIAPRSIELYGPRLSVRRARDGSVDIGLGGADTDAASEALARGFFERLIAPPSLDRPMSYLSRVAVIGGALTVRDQVLNKSWNLPVTDIRLNRLEDRLSGELNLVLDESGRTTELVADGSYMFDSRRVLLDFRFDDVAPAVFSSLAPRLRPLEALDMPISGNVGVTFPLDGGIDRIAVDIVGGRGKVALPEPFGQTIDIKAVKLQADFSGDAGVKLNTFDVTFAQGAEIYFPKPIDHAEPVRRLSARGEMSPDGGTIKLDQLVADIGGPIVRLSAALEGIGQGDKPIGIGLSGEIDKMPVPKLPSYWPKSVSPNPRQWVTARIREGQVENVRFESQLLARTDGSFEVVSLDGGMEVRDAVVDYLPPMPPVEGVSARIRFDRKTFTIYAESGRSQGLEIESGRIVLTGLDQFDQFADIDLQIKGSVPDKLAYIDNKPFEFTSALDLNLDEAAGDARTRLKLFFIVEYALTMDQIKVWARSKLRQVRLRNIFLGRGIDQGELEVRVDTRGMDVKGDVLIEEIPARLTWRENFTDKPEFRSRYNLRAEISDVRQIRDIGLDMQPFSGDYIRGGVKPDITYTVFDGPDRRLELRADISDAVLLAPAFGWSKPRGQEGRAEVVVDLENNLIVDIPGFSLNAADLDIRGSAKYALDGTGLERVDFERVAYGRTDMKGALIPKSDGGWEAGFHGQRFDLAPLWRRVMADNDADEADPPFLDRLTLAVEFDRVWLDDAQELRDVSGTFARAGNVWQTILMSSRVGEDAAFDLEIRPRPDGNRDFTMRADNAGEVLKALELYPNMVGGKLEVDGVYDDAEPGQPLKGTVKVSAYRIINAPALAHVVSIMSLTGILEALQGEGLAFSNLEIPFVLGQGTFELKDAKATGTSLGFTASGKVFRYADVLDLEGTVIPAYALNSAFGRIPVLGELFTGGEKGGGVFAATYTITGPTDKPVVSVNPLSALAPGFLRNVFGILSRTDPENQPDGANGPSASPQ